MAVDQIEMEAVRAALNSPAHDRRADEVRRYSSAYRDDAVRSCSNCARPSWRPSSPSLATNWLPACSRMSVPAMAARLLVKLSRAQAADVLEEMQPDDATDVVEELPPDQVEAILVEMRASEADAIRDLLTYGPETAGGRMTPSFVALAPDLNVDLALAALRRSLPMWRRCTTPTSPTQAVTCSGC